VSIGATSFGHSTFYQSAIFAKRLRNVYLNVLHVSRPNIAVPFVRKLTGIITGICAEKPETMKRKMLPLLWLKLLVCRLVKQWTKGVFMIYGF
jgi:hypothetical protein